jgi:MFS family permease
MDASRAAARRTLVVLTLLNLVNYLDRYVVPAVQEDIRRDLHVNDEQLGLLTTGFVVVYMVASPVFGWLGDRGSRTRLIGFGVAVWSFATASSGLAATFWLLLAARMAVGIGEAAYGTIAPAVLSDSFPREIRGRVFSIFYAAIPIGSALGYIVGGVVSARWGWPHAFYLTAIPGLLLAVLAFGLRDPGRGAQGDDEGASPDDLWTTYRALWNNPMYVITVVGYAAGTFAIGGLGVWLPTFLERVRHLDNAAEIVGGVMAVSGLVGTLAGGWLGDAAQRRNRDGYLWVSGISSLLAVPATMLALRAPSATVFLPAIFVGSLLVFASTGPINTLVVNVVHPSMRATALAACTLSIHLFGDALSPTVIGWLSDRTHSLASAILIVPVVMAVSGLVWTSAAWNGRGRK